MEKDTNNIDHLPKDNQLYQTFSLILKDSKGVYLYRKSEKISKAFFLLTQHLDDGQSIKLNLRNAALSLLDKSQAFLVSSKLSEEQVREVVLKLMSLASLSDIALSAKLISDANCKIIAGQIQIFVSEVYEHLSVVLKDSSLIPSTLFDVSYLETPGGDVAREKDIFGGASSIFDSQTSIQLKGQSTKVEQAVSRFGTQQPARAQPYVAPQRAQPEQQRAQPASPKPESAESNDQKNQRQQMIVDTIRQKGELSIKDLTDVIKGCSEKTIQRELLSLVNSGVLLKTGERRWSRYSVSN